MKKQALAFATLAAGFLLGASALSAAASGTWSAPTAPPPGNNVDAPINVGGNAQAKTGLLGLSSFLFNPTGTANIPIGSVLTATDASGDVSWGSAGSGGTSGGPGIVMLPAPIDIGHLGTNYSPYSMNTYGIGGAQNALVYLYWDTGTQPNGAPIVFAKSSNGTNIAIFAQGSGGQNTYVNQGGGEAWVPVVNNQINLKDTGNQGNHFHAYIIGYNAGGNGNTGSQVVSGVSGIIAGNNITISSTGSGGTGAVTINSTGSSPGGTGAVCGGYYLNSNGALYLDTGGNSPWGCASPANQRTVNSFGGTTYCSTGSRDLGLGNGTINSDSSQTGTHLCLSN